ncbi:MAG: CPBP family intramembrane metalloprotease [Clostridia bacterium]|nr:CPBP family intramembrane metalloprotease [Clostridia bacterium]
MEKNSISRLLHVFVPFIIMVMIQNLLRLLWDGIGFEGDIGELISFVIASAAAVIFFTLTNPTEVVKIPKTGVFRSILHLLFCIAMLIVCMYLVSMATNHYTTTSVNITAVYVVSLLLIHPIVEEYIFRGMFYGELRKINPIFGIIATSIMFAIIHDSIDGMIYALVAGIFLGLTTEKTGRHWVPVLAHMLLNLRSLLYLEVLAENEVLRHGIDVGIVAAGFAGFLVLLILKNIPTGQKTADPEGETQWIEIE